MEKLCITLKTDNWRIFRQKLDNLHFVQIPLQHIIDYIETIKYILFSEKDRQQTEKSISNLKECFEIIKEENQKLREEIITTKKRLGTLVAENITLKKNHYQLNEYLHDMKNIL